MPPRKRVVPEEPQIEPEPSQSETEEEDAPPVPEKPAQRRGDIHQARAVALKKIQERALAKKKEAELKNIRQQNERDMIEIERMKALKDAEDLKRMKEKLTKAKPRSSKARKVQPVEYSSSEESEPEVQSRPSAQQRKPRAPQRKALPEAGSNFEKLALKRAYDDRMNALRQSLLHQAFGM